MSFHWGRLDRPSLGLLVYDRTLYLHLWRTLLEVSRY